MCSSRYAFALIAFRNCCDSCMRDSSTPFSRSASTSFTPVLSARCSTSATWRLPAAADEPSRLRPNRAPSSSAQSTTLIVTGGCWLLNIRIASSPAITPSAPSSHPPLGTESRWLPMMTVRSDAPLSVAQLLPAASISGVMSSSASLPLNHCRASRHTGPHASRCAPSAFDVSFASSRRFETTSCALIARQYISSTDFTDYTDERPLCVRAAGARAARRAPPALAR